jgi:hypothetical protein
MQDTVTAAFKDTVGEALAEYRHGVQTKEEDADDESDFPLSHSTYARRKKSKRENEYHVRLYNFCIVLPSADV